MKAIDKKIFKEEVGSAILSYVYQIPNHDDTLFGEYCFEYDNRMRNMIKYLNKSFVPKIVGYFDKYAVCFTMSDIIIYEQKRPFYQLLRNLKDQRHLFRTFKRFKAKFHLDHDYICFED